ncbi:MAG: hypothetical protein HC828_10790 [Blastochloris sp.]|nr:hypothetical protein [Blastochloris sp.]
MPRISWLCFTMLLIAAPTMVVAQTDTSWWWNDRVFYEIFVRSFYDSDGDGIGDIRGIIEQFDYLNDGDPTTTTDLGVTGLWLMPIMPSPSYHGYDVTDYLGIEEDYGTLEDFRELVTLAHERDVAIIIDLVMNHTSLDHPWFQASVIEAPEYADWYVWEEDNPGFTGPAGQRVWHPWGSRYYYGLFWDRMPDLNFENPDVTAEMFDIAEYWLDDIGVDGFRLDAIKHLIEEGTEQENTDATRDWMRDFDAHITEVNPASFTVGEVWSNSFDAAEYVGDGVDLVFEFDLAAGMVTSARGESTSAVESLVERAQGIFPMGQYATFLTNHDQNRVMDQVGYDVDAARMAASLLLTTPGVPFLYYGEEIGLTGRKPDERIRTPMIWTLRTLSGGFTSGEPWQPLAEDYEFGGVDGTGCRSAVAAQPLPRAHPLAEHAARAATRQLCDGGQR